ncbi:MAG TPA: hypothetical protein DEG74_03590 [Clostridiales bacterium]|nr:hypothetical protein [Clostridiales bacterium]
MSICKYCKHVSEDGTRFCKVCGKALDVFPDTPVPQTSGFPPVPPLPQPAPSSYQNAQSFAPDTESKTPEPKPLQNTPNTFPMNDKDRQAYAENLQNPGRPDNDGICVLALIFGMISIFFNPFLLNSILALILGIVGHACGGPKKDIAKVGWILGLITMIIYIVIRVVFAVLAFSLIWWIIRLFI